MQRNESDFWKSRKGKAIIFIISSIIIPAFMGYLAFQYQYHQTSQQEQKFLAREYLNDINFVEFAVSNFEDYIYNPASLFNNQSSNYYHRAIWWQDPIYPPWGMYYSNREDLAKFDNNLSKNLILFYGMTLTAESQREEYNNYDKLFPRDQSDPFLEGNRDQNLRRIWTNMALNINSSRSLIPQLKQDLQKIADS